MGKIPRHHFQAYWCQYIDYGYALLLINIDLIKAAFSNFKLWEALGSLATVAASAFGVGATTFTNILFLDTFLNIFAQPHSQSGVYMAKDSWHVSSSALWHPWLPGSCFQPQKNSKNIEPWNLYLKMWGNCSLASLATSCMTPKRLQTENLDWKHLKFFLKPAPSESLNLN